MFKRVQILAVLFTWMFATSSQAASTICKDSNRSRLESSQGAFQSSKDLFALVGQKSNLHIFGDMHFRTDSGLMVRVINELNTELSGSNKCLFLEWSKGALAQLPARISEYLKRDDLDEEKRTRLKSIFPYYQVLVTAAEQNGMKVFEIDHPDHFTDDKTEDERNEAMAQIASTFLSDSTCDSAIFFVGKAHISPLENRNSVVDLLKNRGVQPITYNLADYGEQVDYRLASWAGLNCSPRDQFPAAFSNTLLEPATYLYPFFQTERKPLWNDFDYSVSR
ncbi:MAG: hypothetical protein AB7O96_09900 [Pseudobdellovibrionaceae bacterium]